MPAEVDLSELALPRGGQSEPRVFTRTHVATRYVLPALLLVGFAGLVVWGAKDNVFPPHEVTVVPVRATHSQVRREGATLFKAAGWIEPRPTPVRVAALAPGVVEKLLVVEDQLIREGEPVAQLVSEDARLAHERAVAELELRKAEVEEAQAVLQAAIVRFEQPVHLEAPLAEAAAALAQIETKLKNLPFEIHRAEAQLGYAERNYDGKSASQGALSGRQIDQARNELATSKAWVEELKKREESFTQEHKAMAMRRDALDTALRLKTEETRAKNEAEARVKTAGARVQQSEIAVAEAQLRLERMTIRAPVAGRVLNLVADPGTRLMDGAGLDAKVDGSTVVTMYRPDSLQVRVDVRFEDIPKVTLGQFVQIESPAISEPLQGKVLLISSEANIQKNTLQVKVELDSPPVLFKPEMLVDVTFLAPRSEQEDMPSEELQLLVPQPLVKQSNAGPFVWLADQSEGVVKKVPVEVGDFSSDGLIEITKGLTISSRLIASDDENLEDGDRIRVAGEAAAMSMTPLPTTSGKRTVLTRFPTGHDP